MARVSPSALFNTYLGEGSGVNIFIPKRLRLYHVQFRIRDPGRASGWRQVFRSCGSDAYEAAKTRAAEIFVEEASGKPKAGSEALPTAQLSKPPICDPGVAEVIDLHITWMNSAVPGERRPSKSTAHNYRLRFQQLCRLLGVETVGQLKVKMRGLNHAKLGVSEANFVPLVRGAAGVFRRDCLEFYKQQGLIFEVPLNSGPKIKLNEFDQAPSGEQLEKLKAAAEDELKTKKNREYIAFKMLLNGGLRAQEAAHVRWVDVTPSGIRVSIDAGRCSAKPDRERYQPKSRESRVVPVDPAVMRELEQYRKLPLDYVIPLTKAPRYAGYVPKIRCQCVFRSLAAWIRLKLVDLIPDLKNPNHWLRKVFGSVVAMKADVPTVKAYLGHSKASTVAEQVYVSLLHRPAVTIGFSTPNNDLREAS